MIVYNSKSIYLLWWTFHWIPNTSKMSSHIVPKHISHCPGTFIISTHKDTNFIYCYFLYWYQHQRLQYWHLYMAYNSFYWFLTNTAYCMFLKIAKVLSLILINIKSKNMLSFYFTFNAFSVQWHSSFFITSYTCHKYFNCTFL